MCLLAMLAGLLIVQECLFLMYLCIKSGYTAAAAWLTAATGVGEAIIIAGANGYLSLAKSDHKRGGITFEAAKANNFRTDTEDNGRQPRHLNTAHTTKAPSQDFTVLSRGLFLFSGAFAFTGAQERFSHLGGRLPSHATKVVLQLAYGPVRWCSR